MLPLLCMHCTQRLLPSLFMLFQYVLVLNSAQAIKSIILKSDLVVVVFFFNLLSIWLYLCISESVRSVHHYSHIQALTHIHTDILSAPHWLWSLCAHASCLWESSMITHVEVVCFRGMHIQFVFLHCMCANSFVYLHCLLWALEMF